MHKLIVHLFALLPVHLCMPAAPANDDCSNPQIVSGAGPFAFDTTFATTGSEGQANYTCANPTGIERDVWFSWTPTVAGPMVVSLCGGASFDTKVAVYPAAGCPSTVADACNDDSCGLQSEGFFVAVAGNTYGIQIGSSPGASGGAGTFTIHPDAGDCAAPSAGPDLILGDIGGVLNVSAANGLDAVAFGTTGCNIGDAPVNWFAPTNLHPVVATNVLRYQIVNGAGRLEQVGLGWLKHGFGAAVDSLCCACQNPLDPQRLGVGCSDTYDAGLNGTQSILGPRWQVNAHTGVFTFPPANPSMSGPTARRCEVLLADLQPAGSGVRWFAEGAYVTHDDALGGNNDNNESCRELLISGGPADFTFATTGDTLRRKSGVELWAAIEAGVHVAEARVPAEGRFLVGSAVTSLGGGLYHYEYAVHNMNSDRACGAFSVSVPTGATLTNIGFHDVTYRNGDGPANIAIDGTDWSSTLAGSALTWSTQTEAQNVRANAIRWATTYNFRFDANVPPADGFVTLGLWKSGSPASIVAGARVPGGSGTASAFCFGDGSGTPCPCGNQSPVGAHAGCLSSLGMGATLSASGTASVSADTFTLHGASMPDSSSVLYFQGTAAAGSGAGATFGDGLRCAGGTISRLGRKTNAAGASSYPEAGNPPISMQGSVISGDVREYQCWYRNAASFCTSATFNLTNGLSVDWRP